ncbi:MAG: hypothetical protein ACYSTG_05415 [Planctomycetota bacterium]
MCQIEVRVDVYVQANNRAGKGCGIEMADMVGPGLGFCAILGKMRNGR